MAADFLVPVNIEPVDDEEYQHAIGLAKVVVLWAGTMILEKRP